MTDKIPEDFVAKIRNKLPITVYLAYGMGHVLNDVCAAMWFSYLLVFFHLVLEFENGEAGILLLVGQVADAIATPFVGYHSDKDHDWWIYKYGKRKVWYLIGTFCVILTFPFIFSPCFGCKYANRPVQMVYYSFFIVIFQFGWASVQIAHMSLIPEITENKHEKTKLAAVRNGATVIASVLVYIVTWAILHLSGSSNNKISPNDASKFQHIVWSVMSFGLVCSIIFYVFVKEPETYKNLHDCKDEKKSSFKELFTNFNMYLVATVYMSSRLFINLTQVFISLYLDEALNMVASALALVPLAMYIASFVASFPVGHITKKAGRKVTYILGVLLGLCACLWIRWGRGDNYTTYYIFVVATLLGSASTIVLVSSLDITTNLIGAKTNSGAFIYGIMSFADKLSNGLAVETIQGNHKDKTNIWYYRDCLTYVCGGALLLGTVAVLIIQNKDKNKTNLKQKGSISTIS